MAGKKPTHGQLGVTSVANETATTGTIAGVKVADATAGSPAAKAGIEKGDIITAVGKVPVTSYTDLAGQVRAYAAGSKVPVTYSRGGQAHTVTVTLGTAASLLTMGAAWGIAVVGMLAVLLVVFILRLKRFGPGSGRMIALGVVIGLALVGIGLLSQRLA